MGYFLISNMKITLTFAILALFCAAVSCEIAAKEEKKDYAVSDKTSKDTVKDENTDENKKAQDKDNVLDENTDENKKAEAKDTVLDENTDENKKAQDKDDDFFFIRFHRRRRRHVRRRRHNRCQGWINGYNTCKRNWNNWNRACRAKTHRVNVQINSYKKQIALVLKQI